MLSASDMKNHWLYFQSLDHDLDATRLFVEHEPFNATEPSKLSLNDTTFSMQFYKILASAATEFESIAKLLCAEKDIRLKKGANIADISKSILDNFPQIIDAVVQTPRGAIKPLQTWKITEEGRVDGLDWWSSYTALKHNRYNSYKQANLLNATYAMSCLLVLELYLTMVTQSSLDLAVESNLRYFSFPYGAMPFYVQRERGLPGF